jgi:flagellar basal body P-ring formation protein FlgA
MFPIVKATVLASLVVAIAAPYAFAQSKMATAPSPVAPISAGSIVSAGDLAVVEIPEAQARSGVLLQADRIVGLEARRMLMPGQPIRATDLKAPSLVKKGEAVTMIYRAGNLMIAASGRAMESGGKGDVVRVQNSTSRQIIEATVDSMGAVRVAGLNTALLAAR